MPTTRLARLAAALVAGAAAAAAPAAAQVAVTYNGSTTGATAFPFTQGGSSYAYYVGPESGTVKYVLPNVSTVQTLSVNLFCVDFLDRITAGQTYTANVSYLNLGGTSSKTRTTGGLQQYRQAAFLVDQFAAFSNASDRDTKFGAIQGAIWRLFGTGATTLANPGGATGNNTIEYWTALATNFAASAQYSTYDYSRFAVLTDTRVSGTGAARYGDAYAQEFIATLAPTTTAPEPASVALVAAGLLGLGALAARRQVQSAAEVTL
jgi:hypothetical protein